VPDRAKEHPSWISSQLSKLMDNISKMERPQKPSARDIIPSVMHVPVQARAVESVMVLQIWNSLLTFVSPDVHS